MRGPNLEDIFGRLQDLQIDAPEIRVFLCVLSAFLAEPALRPGPPDRP